MARPKPTAGDGALADRPAATLHFGVEAFAPLIRQVVEQTLAALEGDRARLGDKLCYSEEEAADLLVLEPHVLRDERRRGRITASRIVGRRLRYLRQDLLDYLLSRRTDVA
jgi:hypothetical protein